MGRENQSAADGSATSDTDEDHDVNIYSFVFLSGSKDVAAVDFNQVECIWPNVAVHFAVC